MSGPAAGQGDLLELEVGAVAHGGHCVARLPAGPDGSGGRVVFVRHALPGERVRARVTDGGETAAFWRADAVEVLRASPHRVDPPCPWAGPPAPPGAGGGCGGCDFQHVDVGAQRALKGAVVTEQLARLAGLEVAVEVEALDGPGVDVGAGLGWRTRVQYAVGPAGRAGLRRHRSHEVVPIDWCRIASPEVREVAVPTAARWTGVAGVEVVAPARGRDRLVLLQPASPERRVEVPALPHHPSVAVSGADGLVRVSGRTWVAQDVDLPGGPRTFRVTGSGFWQVHPGAPGALAAAVLDAARPEPGERAVDLYAGVGLFAAALAQAVGEDGRVASVESDARAASDARRNLRDLPQVRIVADRVDRALRRPRAARGAAGPAEGPVAGSAVGEAMGGERADVVVLDPPRTGAKGAVVAAVAALAPRVVVYVACDPAALARDVATFSAHGYVLDGLRAFDLFPHTQHVECVARLVPGGGQVGGGQVPTGAQAGRGPGARAPGLVS